MKYDDMTLEVSDVSTRTEEDKRLNAFKVRVLASSVGDMAPGDAVAVEYDDKDLQSNLAKLDRRELDAAGLAALGRTLAALLLPISAQGGETTVREFFARSLVKLGPDAGLRLRLRLPPDAPDLAVIPWEYAYVERAGGGGIDGFLALDPRIAIVRHEVLDAPVSEPVMSGDIKVVVALAEAEGLGDLNLDDEMKFLNEALRGLPGIRVEPCRQATLQKLQPLLVGAGVFHFAGHGDFTRKMGAKPGTYTGVGFLAIGDERIDAEQMGINLHGQGIRLAVLGGCNTGRRDGISVWSGIAPALVKAEIPAVVANQYKILDKCAVAFSHQFYQALAGGLPIERAVSVGRIAAYNADKTGRDWGVPVLYLRAADGQLFAGAADPQARERSKQAAEADVKVRASAVKAGGVLVGADVHRMVDGKLAVAVSVAGTVLGKVVGGDFGRLEGGSATVQLDVGEVGPGASVVGGKFDTLGGGGSRRPSSPTTAKPSPVEIKDWGKELTSLDQEEGIELLHVLQSGPRLRGEAKTAALSADVDVGVGSATGGHVIGTQFNQREGDTVHGTQVNVASGGQGSVNTGISGPVNITGPVTFIQGPTGTIVDPGFRTVI
ncbi:CHAT domain-containing protein [uncultured Thiodictyon sp.]|uniref:CHAT domain-containing protein n=1 Tax=uncultured Thiodictyon sp. TaxID=1846217 RepID=UPI0025DB9BE6|nr:CHAT domain-containing protein [uncultured Thiodictyon sp.]